MIKLFLFCVLFSVPSISCISNSSFESMRKGILPFNNAGNSFFNLIRGEIDPRALDIGDADNLTFSMISAGKISSSYLSHSILVGIGIAFAVLMPIVGFIFCICRCCGKCGGRVRPMDPKNVKCKKVCYGIALSTLTIAMIFAVIITLFNNQIVHEALVNKDQSINIFLQFKSQINKIKTDLQSMKSEIDKSEASQIDNQDLQTVNKELEGALNIFFDNYVKVPEVLNLMEKSVSINRVTKLMDSNKYQKYLKEINDQLKSHNTVLQDAKSNISQKLSTCKTSECDDAKRKTDALAISTINEDNINAFVDVLRYLSSKDFTDIIQKVINFKNNGLVDMKLILDNEIKNLKDEINKKSFTDSVKETFMKFLDKISRILNISEVLPYPYRNETIGYENYITVKNYEQYRYYIYIGLCAAIVLMIIFYFLGLLYGACGERPEEDASCFNRGVGANFLMISITITFLLSTLVMIVVLKSIVTTSIIQTDVCQYKNIISKENNHPIYSKWDQYLRIVLKATIKYQGRYDGMIEALLGKCEKNNAFVSFESVFKNNLLQMLEKQFNVSDEKSVLNLANQLSLAKYLNEDPFKNTSSINSDKLIDSVSMSLKDDDIKMYLANLNRLSIDFSSETQSLNALVLNMSTMRTVMRTIFQNLNNVENDFKDWKNFAGLYEKNKIMIIKSNSAIIVKNIKQNILSVLNKLFSTMFGNVSCSKLRLNLIETLSVFCDNIVDPVNGCWYGLGFFLLLVIPALVFACLLVSLYRRIQKFYPDKEEPDYENYYGFYARNDVEPSNNNRTQNKAPHRGYKPIPLQ